jgi:hypothetical protein
LIQRNTFLIPESYTPPATEKPFRESGRKSKLTENIALQNKENPQYPAIGPSDTGYEKSTPYGPSTIELGETYLILPGHGTAKNSCGEVRFAVACSDEACRHKHGYHLYTECCHRLTCPICRNSAIARAAKRAVERIEGLTKAYEEEGVKLGPISHCQLSPPQDSPLFTPEALSSKEGLNRAYQEGRKMLQNYCRGYGGVFILHPWRQIHLDGSHCGRHDCREKHTWYWSPHFHFIGVGWWLKSDEFYRQTGWVYSKFGYGVKKRQGVDERTRSLFNTLNYQLSHCGILVEGKHIYDRDARLPVLGTIELAQVGQVVRYVGLFSNSKGGFRVEKKTFEVQACPHCKSDMHKFDLVMDDKGDWLLHSDRGQFKEWVEVKRWYINHRQRQTRLQTASDG